MIFVGTLRTLFFDGGHGSNDPLPSPAKDDPLGSNVEELPDERVALLHDPLGLCEPDIAALAHGGRSDDRHGIPIPKRPIDPEDCRNSGLAGTLPRLNRYALHPLFYW